jgi:hypothetical protein
LMLRVIQGSDPTEDLNLLTRTPSNRYSQRGAVVVPNGIIISNIHFAVFAGCVG